MMLNFKRMWHLLKGHYHLFFISIVLIVFIQILNFVSPLIVKQILDECLLGIETYEWVEVDYEYSDKYVFYNNKYYIQEKHISDNDLIDFENNKHVNIVINGGSFYFVDDVIIEGSKKLEGNTLTITNKEETKIYEVSKLNKEELTSFYNPIVSTLIFFIVLLFIKSILVIVFTYIQRLSTSRALTWLARDGRTLAFTHIETLPISYFEEEPAGKMAARIAYDVDGFLNMYRLTVNTLVNAVLSFVFAYVGMFILDYKLALLSLLIYPIAYVWIKVYLKYLKKIAEKVNELKSLLTAKINEIINGINILQVFNFKNQTVKEFNEINSNYRDEQLKEVKLHITLGWNMINVTKAVITSLIVIYFGLQHLSFKGIVITAGLIYAYNEYLLKIIDPINIVFNQISDYQHSQVQMSRIYKIIDGPSEDYSIEEKPKYKGDIKFDNIWFSYVKDEYVLKGVSIDIKAGQMIGLVGHTGCGKTSLMNLLLRFYDINNDLSGKIYLDGEDITKYSKRTYRNGIGIVLQEPVLFKGDIASNIRFGIDISDEEIINILKRMGGEKFLNKFENGIHQEISRAGLNMSSGEKQIISLARTFVHDPSILIMDEATSHIDTETEEIIKTALNEICKNRTVIIIAHRLSTIYNADKIIVMDHGLKVEEGTHEELLEKNGAYANIYRAQIANSNYNE